MKTKLFLLLVSLVCSPLAHGVDVDVSVAIRLGKVLPPPPPEVIVVESASRPGPPPWAPAHGFRRKHSYYYYPGADVYFRPEDRVWFYLEGRNWRFGASLPTTIRVDFDRAVSLSMETDQPHQFHNEVRGYYPADYFVTKVKVKEKHDKPDPGNSPHANDDSPGKNKGKGKGKNK
jgi:hypothetical protein